MSILDGDPTPLDPVVRPVRPRHPFGAAAVGYTALTPTHRIDLLYNLFADVMNYTYRELMDVTHLGLYAYENGFEILRHGRIKAHNGIAARPR